jgi:hypothetical protein
VTCIWRSARGRQWISVALAYALAVHMVISGFAVIGWQADAGNVVLASLCLHDNGSPAGDPRDGNGRAHEDVCALCTVMCGSLAILASGRLTETIRPTPSSDAIALNDERVIVHLSPTGQYSRGPPSDISVAG